MNTLKIMSKLKFHVDSESARYQNWKLILKKLQKITMFYNVCILKKSFGTDDFHKIYKKSLNTYFFICADVQNCLGAIIYKSWVSALIHAWRGRHWEKIHESDWSIFFVLKNREILIDCCRGEWAGPTTSCVRTLFCLLRCVILVFLLRFFTVLWLCM